MKTLTILFESPNVFYAVIDGVNIRIDNPEILNATLKWRGAPNEFAYTNQYGLKNGQTFQVEGFEYDHKWINPCIPHKKCLNESDDLEICKQECKKLHLVAILKLAKEEESKEQLHYDEKLFIETWYHRNPVHEKNANTGEDMFWRCAFMVMEDYINKLKK